MYTFKLAGRIGCSGDVRLSGQANKQILYHLEQEKKTRSILIIGMDEVDEASGVPTTCANHSRLVFVVVGPIGRRYTRMVLEPETPTFQIRPTYISRILHDYSRST